MATIYFPEEYRDLVDGLYGAGRPFRTMWEVAVFAASIAADEDLCELLPTSARGRQEISDQIFKQNDREGLVYLLALKNRGNSSVFDDDQDDLVWRIFEGYVNSGVQILHSWRLQNPTDIEGDATILEKITHKAKQLHNAHDDSAIEVDPTF